MQFECSIEPLGEDDLVDPLDLPLGHGLHEVAVGVQLKSSGHLALLDPGQIRLMGGCPWLWINPDPHRLIS